MDDSNRLEEHGREIAVLKDWRVRTDAEMQIQRDWRHLTDSLLHKQTLELENLRDDMDTASSTVDGHTKLLLAADMPQLATSVRILQDTGVATAATNALATKRSEKAWQVISGVLTTLIITLVMWYVGLHKHHEPAPGSSSPSPAAIAK